jgi:hypothetical protein
MVKPAIPPCSLQSTRERHFLSAIDSRNNTRIARLLAEEIAPSVVVEYLLVRKVTIVAAMFRRLRKSIDYPR